MHHSIIIPHRNRVRELRQTLWSIAHAAFCSAVQSDFVSGDCEVIVVHAGVPAQHDEGILTSQPFACCQEIHSVDVDHPRVFNKPRLLNIGIEAARGDILTFLDADMIAGPQWMHETQRRMLHDESPPTRLCYRVRQLALPKTILPVSTHEQTLSNWEDAEEADLRDVLLSHICLRGASYPKAAEAYGQPNWTNNPQVRTPVFGNSQWSILRDVLGDLRFDEAFEGAGFEDLDLIDMIWRTVPEYRGEIITDPFASLYHLHHERKNVLGSDWCDPKLNLANQRMYYRNAARRRHAQRSREQARAAAAE